MNTFVLQSNGMDNTPLTQRPWFYIISWLVFLLAVYGWQIARMGGIQNSLLEILFDLLCVFPILLLLWLAFFSQFILPVHTFRDRQKIFDRLLADLFSAHGPALSIENGEIHEHSGERLKKGPGVVWLDSASAAVTRTTTTIKQVLGPGVHFLDNGEEILNTVDLHYQVDTIGPKENEDPFASEQSDSQKTERRQIVKALTRDGIEVVPEIMVRFRVDTGFPREGEPGSRFGFRSGNKKNENMDKEAIRKAILGEAINPNMTSEMPRRRVAWNELPAMLAVDVWREYAAKFTLDQFFESKLEIPMPPPTAPQPEEEEIDLLTRPVLSIGDRRSAGTLMAQLLRPINHLMSNLIQRIEGTKKATIARPAMPAPAGPLAKREPTIGTALQVINKMVEMRLTRPYVPGLDETGSLTNMLTPSKEYEILKAHGLAVDTVKIGNIRFNKEIEKKIIEKWAASWLKNAKDEEERIKRQKEVIASAAHEKAYIQYASRLSSHLLRKQPQDVKQALKELLLRTRTIILTDDKLREDMKDELANLDEILHWVEEEE
jgi:hypothetical protein